MNIGDAEAYAFQDTIKEPDVSTQISFAERAILSNQYQILEKLDPEHASDYAQSREIVEAGYESLYETINPAIHTTSVPAEASKEVTNILDMFRALEVSTRRIGSNAEEFAVAFQGFDGNNDEHHYGFAYFVRRKQGRWSELSHYPDNSHAETLPRYRQMLETWHSIGKPHEMTEDQIKELARHR